MKIRKYTIILFFIWRYLLYFLGLLIGMCLGCIAGFISCRIQKENSFFPFSLYPLLWKDMLMKNDLWILIWGISFSWILIFMEQEQQLWMLLLFSASCFPAQIDSHTGFIPDFCLWWLFLMGAVSSAAGGRDFVTHLISCIGALIFMAGIYFICSGKMGSGDIFFAFRAVSLDESGRGSPFFVFSFAFRQSVGNLFMYDKEKSLYSSLPFGPFSGGKFMDGISLWRKNTGENMKLSSYRKGFILWEILFFYSSFYFCHGAVYSCSMGFITKNNFENGRNRTSVFCQRS